MERIIYDRMADLDSRHWWYRARREVLAKLIARKVRPPRGARILEIGCATGHNLGMLARFGAVEAVELDEAARAIASQRLGRPVAEARLPELAGVPEQSYDLVALLDVLEHVEDDRAALASIARRLKPGGALLITVPAFQWMWSVHDEVNHHKRRYTKQTLRAAIAQAGLRADFVGYFNSILFPLAVTGRQIGRMTGKLDSDDKMPARPVNALLQAVFALERHGIGRVPFSPGVSIAAVVRAA
jgi:2-polyprenyl-3-methyl-5-hydroxy-6-metoxy-1,4-benzoquinol methylase